MAVRLKLLSFAALAAAGFGTAMLEGSSTSYAVGGTASLDVHVVSQTSKTLTLGWTPADGEGYLFKLDGTRISNTWDPKVATVRFSIRSGSHTYTVDALVAGATGSVLNPPATVPTTTTTTTIPTTTTVPTTTTAPAGSVVTVSLTGNDMTCARNGAACSTPGRAYDISQPGDVVTIGCGSYSGIIFSSIPVRLAGPNVVFQPVTPYCVTLKGIHATAGSLNYSTWRNFVINDPDGGLYAGGSSGGQFSYGLVLDSDRINVDQPVTTQNINLHLVSGFQLVNNTIGPTCCGTNSDSDSPEGIRIGTPGGGNSTNVTITGNLIQGVVRDCKYWPASYSLGGQTLPAGLCPAPSCGNCHMDGIHLWGITNSVISNNKLDGVEVQGIFIEDTNGGLNSNLTVSGNTIATVGGNCAICIDARAGTHSISGTWNIADNQSANEITVLEAAGGAAGPTVFNFARNHTEFFVTDGNSETGCQGFADIIVSATYQSNTWLPVGGGTNGCG